MGEWCILNRRNKKQRRTKEMSNGLRESGNISLADRLDFMLFIY